MAGSVGFMNLTSPALEAEATTIELHCTVNWNGDPFLVTHPVIRKNRIVRTKVVAPELARQYNTHGWPRNQVLMREFTLTLPGDGVVLKIVTNADEAEDELPERILTRHRDIGTFREAKVVWRDRPVTSFVSARLDAPVAVAAAPASAASRPSTPEPTTEHRRILDDVLKSGIVVREDRITEALNPDERLLVNLLIARRSGDPHRPLSLEQIGRHLGISDESVRRRRDALLRAHPHLKRPLAALRRANNKGAHPDAMRSTRTGTEDDETDA